MCVVKLSRELLGNNLKDFYKSLKEFHFTDTCQNRDLCNVSGLTVSVCFPRKDGLFCRREQLDIQGECDCVCVCV